MSYSRTIILGNICNKPEVRFTPKGTAVMDLNIAVNERFKVGESYQEKTTFIDCTVWSTKAEVIAQHFNKGDSILVEGRLEQETWEDQKTGQKRSKLKVVVDNFSFAGGKKKQQSDEETSGDLFSQPVGAGAGKQSDSSDVPF